MGKAKIVGYKRTYIPNNRVDRRLKPGYFFNGKDRAENPSFRADKKEMWKQ